MENLFDSLCSALSESSITQLFLDAEGPDLMILMIKCVNTLSRLDPPDHRQRSEGGEISLY